MNNLKLNTVFMKLQADTCQCMPGISIMFGASVDCYYFHFLEFEQVASQKITAKRLLSVL